MAREAPLIHCSPDEGREVVCTGKAECNCSREKAQQRMEAGAVVLFLVGEQGARAADVQTAGGKN